MELFNAEKCNGNKLRSGGELWSRRLINVSIRASWKIGKLKTKRRGEAVGGWKRCMAGLLYD